MYARINRKNVCTSWDLLETAGAGKEIGGGRGGKGDGGELEAMFAARYNVEWSPTATSNLQKEWDTASTKPAKRR